MTQLLAIVRHGVQAELAQSLIKLCRFGLHSASQSRGDKFVKGPKLLHRLKFEIVRFHFSTPDDLSLWKTAFAQGVILDDSGLLQWSKKAKNWVSGVPQAEHEIITRRNFYSDWAR